MVKNIYQREFFGLKHTSIAIPACDRAKCQMCGKPLPLLTFQFVVEECDREDFARNIAPKVRAWSKVEFREPNALYQKALPKTAPEKTTMLIRVWYGRYEGYSVDADGVPLFCTQPCAIGFAGLAYRSGIRALKEEVIRQHEHETSPRG